MTTSRWVVACAVVAVLAGCRQGGSTPEPDPEWGVASPVSLSVSSSAPATTPTGKVTLTWTLASPVPVALVVRAQGPGDSGAGLEFAGARIATGPVRYLSAGGTWSETPVTYSNSAAAAGALDVVAPLPLEGEWRYDMLAQSTNGQPLALATAAVLLSSKPALRVSLSQRYALPGDAVSGEVVLGSGGTATPVKLKAWWQGPGGAQVPLPDLAPLAFDGEAKDVTLPLLSTRLEKTVAPGTWTLKARLFDAATGALLATGARSLEVCGASTLAVDGMAVGDDGTALSPPAGGGTVTARALGRPGLASASVDSDGAFTLGLEPGTWLLSGRVTDSSGTHVLPPRPLVVGCSAPAPLTLGTKLDVVAKSRRDHKAPRSNTPSAPSRKPVSILVMPIHSSAETADIEDLLAGRTATDLLHAFPGKTDIHTMAELGSAIGFERNRQLAGSQDPASLTQELAGAMGADVLVAVRVIRAGGTTTFRLSAVDMDQHPLAEKERHAPTDPNSSGEMDALEGVSADLAQPSLLEAAYAALDYPLDPVLDLDAPFQSVTPDSTKAVSVTVKDSDGTPFANKTVELVRAPISFSSPVTAVTDGSGVAHFAAVPLGAAANMETLTAQYKRRSRTEPYKSQAHRYGVYRGQLGMLRFNPGIPTIRPLTTLDVEVEAKDVTTGAPQAQAHVEVTANLGGQQATATATTDADGKATVQLPVGADAGLAEVTATLSASSSGGGSDGGVAADAGTPVTATENLVVSVPIAFNAQPPSGRVPNGAASLVSGSLVDNGVPMSGVSVTATPPAGTSVSTASPVSGNDGSFNLGFVPPDTGSGSGVLKLETLADGESLFVDLPVAWGPPEEAPLLWYGPNYGDPPGLTATGTKLVRIQPDGTGQQVLYTDPAADSFCPSLAWTRNHTQIVFTHRDNSGPSVRMMNADGSGTTTVFSWSEPQRQGLVQLSASPDGATVVGHLDPTYVWDSIVTLKLDGSGITSTRPEESGWTRFWALAWGANGKIGVVRTDQQVISVDVSENGNVASFQPLIQWPNNYPADLSDIRGFAWSPDGTEAAIACIYQGTRAIVRLKTTGSGILTTLPLPSNPTCTPYPSRIAYSPDGTRLAYLGCCEGGRGLCTINLDGSGEKLVDPSAEGAISVAW